MIEPIKVYRYIRSLKTSLDTIGREGWRLIRDEALGQYLPPKPYVIQFPVNDICNSRCVMCNIWHRKRDKECTPEEIRQILTDPLFTEIRYVGMSGGEPTLRRDLHTIAKVLVESLPKLTGMGIITNALPSRTVIERSLALKRVADAANITFGVNVSLDGVGEDHDRNRGVKGNFSSAVEVIKALKQEKVPLSVGCTLTPLTVMERMICWVGAKKTISLRGSSGLA